MMNEKKIIQDELKIIPDNRRFTYIEIVDVLNSAISSVQQEFQDSITFECRGSVSFYDEYDSDVESGIVMFFSRLETDKEQQKRIRVEKALTAKSAKAKKDAALAKEARDLKEFKRLSKKFKDLKI